MLSPITPDEQAEWDKADRERAEWEADNPHWRNPHLHAIWRASKAANEVMAKIEKLQPRFLEVAEKIQLYLDTHYPNG